MHMPLRADILKVIPPALHEEPVEKIPAAQISAALQSMGRLTSLEYLPSVSYAGHEEFLEDLIRFYHSGSASIRDITTMMLKHPDCPPYIIEHEYAQLKKLPMADDSLIYLLANPQCPVSILLEQFNSVGSSIKAAIASNPNCPHEFLDTIVCGQEWGYHDQVIVDGVLKNPNCPARLLHQLAVASQANVRSAVARHSKCPVSILKSLVLDIDPLVSQNAAANLQCPPELKAIVALAL